MALNQFVMRAVSKKRLQPDLSDPAYGSDAFHQMKSELLQWIIPSVLRLGQFGVSFFWIYIRALALCDRLQPVGRIV